MRFSFFPCAFLNVKAAQKLLDTLVFRQMGAVFGPDLKPLSASQLNMVGQHHFMVSKGRKHSCFVVIDCVNSVFSLLYSHVCTVGVCWGCRHQVSADLAQRGLLGLFGSQGCRCFLCRSRRATLVDGLSQPLRPGCSSSQRRSR